MHYAILCEDADNVLEKRKSIRPAHLARLQALSDANRLLAAGPLMNQDGENPFVAGIHGSLIIAKFNSLDEAKEWIAADPFVTAEVYKNITVKPFKIVLP
ncbi:MAG: YciI family protein [Gammaproteobacteria bacterium]|nr:YciI family protein [Gammaproteobacteria bacterium]